MGLRDFSNNLYELLRVSNIKMFFNLFLIILIILTKSFQIIKSKAQ